MRIFKYIFFIFYTYFTLYFIPSSNDNTTTFSQPVDSATISSNQPSPQKKKLSWWKKTILWILAVLLLWYWYLRAEFYFGDFLLYGTMQWTPNPNNRRIHPHINIKRNIKIFIFKKIQKPLYPNAYPGFMCWLIKNPEICILAKSCMRKPDKIPCKLVWWMQICSGVEPKYLWCIAK